LAFITIASRRTDVENTITSLLLFLLYDQFIIYLFSFKAIPKYNFFLPTLQRDKKTDVKRKKRTGAMGMAVE